MFDVTAGAGAHWCAAGGSLRVDLDLVGAGDHEVLREAADELTRSLGGKPLYGTDQAKRKPRKDE